ncbi:hypothetical protein GPLA_3751 [Paraglaciecola polaris LMG 21857]|uniref:Uncharacterized protein n=1 Tax=Paraglaciecola polaris LMG 21857 TaxID=1129793 RepID=K6ZEZ2_9ALTE|nr:hypothetical protein GPLA_3751 [Paraglaciecola polaris LMG 21857]
MTEVDPLYAGRSIQGLSGQCNGHFTDRLATLYTAVGFFKCFSVESIKRLGQRAFNTA